MSSTQTSEDQRQLLRRWRVKVFLGTWLSYVGMYFCRKPYYMVKGTLTKEYGMDAAELGDIGTSYLTAYTAGQFLNGAIGTRTGARRMLLVGMTLSVCCNLAFGMKASYWPMMIFMGINGLAQATGWAGNVGTMAHWTTRQERGTIMGLWATCYLVGGILANGLSSFLLMLLSWRWAFFGGAAVLTLIIAAFFFLQRDRPRDVGLPPVGGDDDEERAAGDGRGQGLFGLGWDLQVLITLGLVGSFYFCVKFIRYALWSWAPYFLELNFGLKSYQSGFLSTVFDGAGFFGVLTAGVTSDRLFRGRRAVVAFIMLIGMTAGCLLLYGAGVRSLVMFGGGLALVGFMLYGPDSLLSGAGAIDLGGRRGAIAAAGVINGMGSMGSIVQEKVIGYMYTESGGDLSPIIRFLLGASVLALIFVALVLWRNRAGHSNL